MNAIYRPRWGTDVVLSTVVTSGHFFNDRFVIGVSKLFEILEIKGVPVESSGPMVAKLLNEKTIRWSHSRKSIVFVSQSHPSYSFVCCYCKQRKSKMTKDHVRPKGQGGPDVAGNIVFCCRQCNEVKANRTPSQWAADVIRFRGGFATRLRLLASVAILAFLRQGGAQ